MQQIHYKNTGFSINQKLFIETASELCDYRSLDSYRARVAGPIYILDELYKIIDDWKKQKIKSIETLISCKNEAISILIDDEALDYGRSSKENLIKMLRDIKEEKRTDDKKLEEKKNDAPSGNAYLLPLIEYNLYYLSTINKKYLSKVLHILFELLRSDDTEEATLKRIEKNTSFLISELINEGFSKAYLARFLRAVFIFNPCETFEDCWQIFEERICVSKQDDYIVIFKVNAPEDKLRSLNVEDLKEEVLDTDVSFIEILKGNKKLRGFLTSGSNSRFIIKSAAAYDYYQAIKIAKIEVANLLDLIHLGFNEVEIQFRDTVIVANKETPSKAGIQSTEYQMDGLYKSHDDVYKNLSTKIGIIKNKKFIAREVPDKIEAAIRYLRSGSESIELEQKFLNYWIGLENIFSNYKVNTSTFLRIKNYLTKAHTVSYTKRNIFYFHKSIKRLDIQNKIPGYDDNLEYLNKESTYDILIGLRDRFPLLSIRAKAIKDLYVLEGNNSKTVLSRHKTNLEQHLTRMYRIRNELVHNAATFQNIENITSNLRYYLIFILNKLIEFFSDCEDKGISGKKVEIDDFFLYQEIIWRGIEDEGFDFDRLIKVPHPIEFIV